MMHMPYIQESNEEGSGYSTNQSLPSDYQSHEYFTLPVEPQVGISSGRGKATFPSHFRLHSPITARIESYLMMVWT